MSLGWLRLGLTACTLVGIVHDSSRAGYSRADESEHRVRDRIGVGHLSEHRAQARWHADTGGPQASAYGSDSAYPSRRKCHGPVSTLCEKQT